MRQAKLSKKEQEVARWTEEVGRLKQEAQVKYQEIETLETALERFEVQYDVYIQTLQRQRQNLAERVQRYRFLIQHWGEPESPSPPEQTQRQPPPQEPEPEPAFEEPTKIPPMIERVRPTDDTLEQKRKQTHNFFAWFWHPDTGKQWSSATPDLDLTHQLHTAFEQTEDLVDLLTAIPWHGAWLKRGKDENINVRLGRLIDWVEALEKANERLDQQLARLRQHEFFPLLTEKQAADEWGEDYFAQLAARERDEISRLEETLATLQVQLEELKQPKTGEQG